MPYQCIGLPEGDLDEQRIDQEKQEGCRQAAAENLQQPGRDETRRAQRCAPEERLYKM